jgi:hypothetical protein
MRRISWTRSPSLSAAFSLAILAALYASPAVPARSSATGAVVHDESGSLLPSSQYPGVLPSFEERDVAGAPAAEPWLEFSKTGRAFYVGSQPHQTAGVPYLDYGPTFASDDAVSWHEVPMSLAGRPTPLNSWGDVVLASDPDSGALYKVNYTAGCLSVFASFDDGETWRWNPRMCDIPAIITDHPTVFVGPRVPCCIPTRTYNPVYVCYNTLGGVDPRTYVGYDLESACSRSDDGGLTFLPIGAPEADGGPCEEFTGLTGFGTGSFHSRRPPAYSPVFLPVARCGEAWVARSFDWGVTWRTVLVDRSIGFDDNLADTYSPQIVEDSGGYLYYVWVGNDHLARVSISADAGATWGRPMRFAAPGVARAKFASIAVGKPGRVAVTYIGTNDTEPNAATRWYSYVTMTLDAFAASPVFASDQVTADADPVAVGTCVGRCMLNGSWMGMYDYLRAATHPKTGMVMATVVDLCLEDCASSGVNSSQSRGAVAVQVGGSSLL